MQGNWAATIDLQDASDMVSRKAQELGYEGNADLYSLVNFDTILNDKYGVSSKEAKSMRGVVEGAQTAKDAARAASGDVESGARFMDKLLRRDEDFNKSLDSLIKLMDKKRK